MAWKSRWKTACSVVCGGITLLAPHVYKTASVQCSSTAFGLSTCGAPFGKPLKASWKSNHAQSMLQRKPPKNAHEKTSAFQWNDLALTGKVGIVHSHPQYSNLRVCPHKLKSIHLSIFLQFLGHQHACLPPAPSHASHHRQAPAVCSAGMDGGRTSGLDALPTGPLRFSRYLNCSYPTADEH